MKRSFLSLSIILTAALLFGCSAKPDITVTETPMVAVHTIIAEGHLVPNQGLFLSFQASGRIQEILVKRGDQVIKDQVLVKLGDRQQAESNLASAQLAQVAAQQAYDSLLRTENLAVAQAWQAYLQAQKARAAADLAWDRLDQVVLRSNIDNAQSEVNNRQADLDSAQTEFDKYKDLSEDNNSRKTAENSLRQAQLNYDAAVQKYEQLTQQGDLLQAARDAARAAEAETLYAYQNAQEGADSDRLVLSRANLDQANTQLALAQAVLDNYDLKAPFAGIVADVNVVEGQMIGPDTWAVALANTTRWFVDTSDLGELDVVSLQVGQAVSMTVDALPGLTLEGIVESISTAPKVQSGDILYTVRIRLTQDDKRLRWGMTTEITFINP